MNEQNPSVLLVDGESEIRHELAATLTKAGFAYLGASNLTEAQRVLADHAEVGIVITDLTTSGTAGLTLIEEEPPVSSPERRHEFVVVTGNGNKEDAIRALRLGVLDFFEKPFDSRALVEAVHRAARVLKSRAEHQLLRQSLREDIEEQYQVIANLRDQLSHAYAEPLHCLSEASLQRDHETGAHTRRIGIYARFLARELGWPPLNEARLDLAARLHDVGKIGIPDAILLKQAPLTAPEWSIMKRHTVIGEAILSRSSGSPVIKLAADIAGGHHERWDGTGYPRGLRGEGIPRRPTLVSWPWARTCWSRSCPGTATTSRIRS